MVLKVKLSPRSVVGLKLLVHIGSALPLCWLFWAIPNGLLGSEPVQALEHFLGIGAIRLLLLTLCVSPLAKGLHLGPLLRLRRPLGLWCFTWATCHLASWLAFDLQFAWALIGEEIVKRTYILVGFAAWLILLQLAVTSIPNILRKMGKTWKKLHNWIYAVALLAPVHFLWSVKSGFLEPGVYILIAATLLWLRRSLLTKPLRGRFGSAH